MVGDADLPLGPGDLPGPLDHTAVGADPLLGPGAAEHERARIDRVGEQVVHCGIGRRRPRDGAGPGWPAWQPQPVTAHAQQDLPGAAELLEAAEHRRDRLDDGLVGADDHPPVGVVVEPNRQAAAQLALGGLVAQPRRQPAADQVQLRLAHGALQAEHEPIVVVGWVVDAVAVGDERVGQRAQVQQLIPVGVVAGQAADLDAQDEPHLAQPDVGDQALEALPRAGVSTGAAKVVVDHQHLVGQPAQRGSSFHQLVLALQALGVLPDLGDGRLAHVHVGVSAQMARGDLG
jgi:hypothetical protein